MNDVIRQASAAQARAADPGYNIFVEANAGSGKTRVLVDRVTRLLLGGVAPDTILCLTYTKAAAGEMKTRLFDRLGHWSVLGDEALKAQLTELIGTSGRDDLTRARRLFARALETPGGLKIQTIHAFCESLLRRFPLEASIPPGFDVVDEAHAARFRQMARAVVMRESRRDPSIRQALETLAARSSEALDQVLSEALFDRQRLGDLFARPGLETMLVRLHEALEVEPGVVPDVLRAQAWEAAPHAALASARDQLLTGGKTEIQRGEAIDEALNAPTPQAAFSAYACVFFTGKGEKTPVARLLTNGFAGEFPVIANLLGAEAERMSQARDRVRAAQVAADTAAALRIAHIFLSAYGAALTRARKLDFSDLVHSAARLLHNSEAADWVRYRMDGGVRHILVDEAQDTAPEQWALIEAMTDEFFAGGRESDETVFCVGDEKQSIYSFQGADPKGFIAWGQRLETRSADAGKRFDRPGLSASFRSSGLVLAAVDLAFGPEGGAPELKFMAAEPVTYDPSALAFTRYQSHAPAFDKPGCIEIWPLVDVPAKAEIDNPFDAPVDTEGAGSPRRQLASIIAGEIARMLEDGEAVPGRGAPGGIRPVEPQDVLILVRKRDGFFTEVIRQLKVRGVPVAGADRMVLTEQIAVQDLLSLARFALNPDDDLSLAEVLKSPFFQSDGGPFVLDDDALFDLAHGKRPTLWQVLRDSSDARFADAREALKRVLDSARTTGVHSVFARFLGEVTPTGETRLRRVFARLGEEQRDAVEEFLARALAFEREDTPSLTRFVGAMAGEHGDIKREMEAGRSEVRVMTVHASKGLEAPIVFLPDTTQVGKSAAGGTLFRHDAAGWVWGVKKEADPALVAALREAEEAKAEGERWRLLYVGLTRAESRLIVCGWKHGRAPGRIDERSWYHRLTRLWSNASWAEFNSPVPGAAEPGRRFGAAPVALGAPDRTETAQDIPVWATTPARDEAGRRRSLAPSQLAAEAEPAILSPLAGSQTHRFRRGNLVHKLLQTLPDLSPERRKAAAERFLARQPDLSDAERAEIGTETLRVLEDPEFAPLFGPGSRAEVALGGHAPGLPAHVTLNGQIDRLVVTAGEVMIVDYKTNRPPPADTSGVAPIYWMQMAAYRALLQSIHPDKIVRCALLWTDGPRLMELPGPALDAALAKGFTAQASKLDDSGSAS